MKKVLFVYDSLEDLDTAKRAVDGLNVASDFTDKLSTAYELVSKAHYDYIFLDYKMGSVDADGLLVAIDKGHSKIYIVSGFERDFLERALKDYLGKIEGFIKKEGWDSAVIRILVREENV